MDKDIFITFLRERAKEISPDYPDIDTCDEYELLWSITASYEGVSAACKDWAYIVDKIRQDMGKSKEEMFDYIQSFGTLYERERKNNEKPNTECLSVHNND